MIWNVLKETDQIYLSIFYHFFFFFIQCENDIFFSLQNDDSRRAMNAAHSTYEYDLFVNSNNWNDTKFMICIEKKKFIAATIENEWLRMTRSNFINTFYYSCDVGWPIEMHISPRMFLMKMKSSNCQWNCTFSEVLICTPFKRCLIKYRQQKKDLEKKEKTNWELKTS